MFLKTDSKIFQKFPDLTLRVIVAEGIDNAKKHTAITQLVNGRARKESKLAREDLSGNVVIKAWRDAYRNFGADPEKYPCSIEALLKELLPEKKFQE